MLWYTQLFKRSFLSKKLDDAVGAIPVHGVCGITGGLLVCMSIPSSAWASQIAASLLVPTCAFMAVWGMSQGYKWVLVRFADKASRWQFRVSEHVEKSGIDMSCYRESAYDFRLRPVMVYLFQEQLEGLVEELCDKLDTDWKTLLSKLQLNDEDKEALNPGSRLTDSVGQQASGPRDAEADRIWALAFARFAAGHGYQSMRTDAPFHSHFAIWVGELVSLSESYGEIYRNVKGLKIEPSELRNKLRAAVIELGAFTIQESVDEKKRVFVARLKLLLRLVNALAVTLKQHASSERVTRQNFLTFTAEIDILQAQVKKLSEQVRDSS